jgi:hypothetical protein
LTPGKTRSGHISLRHEIRHIHMAIDLHIRNDLPAFQYSSITQYDVLNCSVAQRVALQ